MAHIVPRRWRANVLIPTNAPLLRLTVRDVFLGDLPAQAAGLDARTKRYAEAAEYRLPAAQAGAYAAELRGGQARVTWHCTWGLSPDTVARCDAVPRHTDAPGAGALAVVERPNLPQRAGNWRDVPPALLPPELRPELAKPDPRNDGRFGRLVPDGHCATILTKGGRAGGRRRRRP